MPRLTVEYPRYRKHKSGQAVVTLNGRDFYLGPHGTRTSKQQYDRLIAEYAANGRRSPLVDAQAPLLVKQICARYWTFAVSHYQKNGRSTRVTPGIKCAMRYVRQLYGETPAENVGPLALKAVRHRMIDVGLSRRYINDLVDTIRRMFRWAVEEEMVPETVHRALVAVKRLAKGRTKARETAPILPVDDATVDATLPHLPIVVADMVRLQRLTGMRPAEVCIMRPMDLDRTAEVWTYKPESHKTEHHGRDRTVFIGPQAQGVLLKYLARDLSMYCFRPCDSEAKRLADRHAARTVPMSCGNRPGSNRRGKPKRTAGDCYDVASYRRAIHRACDKAFPHPDMGTAKVPELSAAQLAELRKWRSAHRWSPNRLRHAAATEVRKKFGLEAAQVILGHAAANVTEIYAEQDLAKGIEVAKRIG